MTTAPSEVELPAVTGGGQPRADAVGPEVRAGSCDLLMSKCGSATLLIPLGGRTTYVDGLGALSSVGVSAGNLHLAREACERWLPGTLSVALLDRDAQVLILPLTRESGGGLLLKVRNARGDRVIHAQEFFRTHGYAEDFTEQRVAMRWDETAAALVLSGLRRAPVDPPGR